jgi:hypothetical protein
MANRKQTEKEIMDLMDMLDPSGFNRKKYEQIFKDMSDRDFKEYMTKISKGEATLVFFAPLDKEPKLTTRKLLDIGKKLDIPFFERLIVSGEKGAPDYETEIEYLVIDLPIKRQSQNLVKKISVPDHNKSIDQLVYQPTGESKGAKVSYPELQILVSMGLEHSIDELIRFRGGDKTGWMAYNSMFMRFGTANLKTLNHYSTGTESTKTLKAYLRAMHVSDTI